MSDHERHTKQHERVYLVASELQRVTWSRERSKKFPTKGSTKASGVFISQREIGRLHERHWAMEVDGQYYELVRDEHKSRFATKPTEQCDRNICARIFLGRTHHEKGSLEAVGMNSSCLVLVGRATKLLARQCSDRDTVSLRAHTR